MTRRATFAIPGSLDALTGGYIYEKEVLFGLRRLGWTMEYLPLPGSFPNPTPKDIASTEAALASIDPEAPVLLDGFLSGAMPSKAFSRMRAPGVAITHHPLAYETGLSAARAGYLKEVEQTNLARMAHVIVPSPHTARILETDYGVDEKRITIAAPGVPRPTTTYEGTAQAPEILVVGQLVPRKGHETLIKALAAIADLDWRASIIGPASDEEHALHLSQLVSECELTERLTIVGTLPPDQLEKRYAQASVFALATLYEGYGMVFAEAMTHGLPIVSCMVGAVPDTVPSDAGVLVAPGDVPAFASALRQILTDQTFREGLAQASSAHGERLPTWDDTARIVGEVLEHAGR